MTKKEISDRSLARYHALTPEQKKERQAKALIAKAKREKDPEVRKKRLERNNRYNKKIRATKEGAEKHRKYSLRWQKENPEKKKIISNRYTSNHREKCNAKSKARIWTDDQKEKLRIYKRQMTLTLPDHYVIHQILTTEKLKVKEVGCLISPETIEIKRATIILNREIKKQQKEKRIKDETKQTTTKPARKIHRRGARQLAEH